MRTLNIAFWNVCNVFEPGIVERGPKTEQELNAKIETIVRVANRFFQGNGPHLLGIAEVHSEPLFERIRTQLGPHFIGQWVPPGVSGQTGLGLLAHTDLVSSLQLVDVFRPVELARPRYMIVKCAIRNHDEEILVIVNHWKSNMFHGGGGLSPKDDRMETARLLGDWLAVQHRTTCVIAMGDFNAEPYEAPFSERALRAVRFFSTALWTNATPKYLYNTAWRHLPEPDLWETVEANTETYKPSRPRPSFDDSPPKLYDQLMVSGRALRGGPVTLIEGSVTYHVDEDTCGRNLKPQRWNFQDGIPTGASDHFPLLSAFRINGGKQ